MEFPQINLLLSLASILIAAAGIAIGIYFGIKALRKKELTCQILERSSLFSADDKIRDELVVLFRDRKIKGLAFTLLEFRNSGNIEILPKDFIEPLSLELVNATELLFVEEGDKTSPDLKVNFEISGSCINIEPLLLNGTDSFVLKVFTDSIGIPSFKIKSRIAGITSVVVVENDPSTVSRRVFWFTFSLAGYSLFPFLLLNIFDSSGSIHIVLKILIALIMGLVIAFSFPVVSYRNGSWEYNLGRK